MRWLPLAALATMVVLSGCSESTTTPAPAPATRFNATDVMFVQMMLPHHEQGAQIVRLVKNRKVRKEVRELAEAIDVTQATEAENMAAWLKEWKAPATGPEAEHAAHGGMPSTSPAAIDALAKASDVEFERQFLNLLIAHQDDAVQMALREKQGGIHEKARELADRIERSRKAQIALMLGYLR